MLTIIRNSAAEFLDLENMGVAAGISLVSCIGADIKVLSSSSAYPAQYPQLVPEILDPEYSIDWGGGVHGSYAGLAGDTIADLTTYYCFDSGSVLIQRRLQS